MISPLWILNSALALMSILVLGVVLLTQERLPSRTSLKTELPGEPVKKDVSHIDIARIYQNDLFGTYTAPSEPPAEEQLSIPPVPEPPAYKRLLPPAPVKPEFLPPLQVQLKGVILAWDDKDTRAILADVKTSKESLYKIGDTIEDAELVHISKNKIILLRSNGQEETIFLSSKDTQDDPLFLAAVPWTLVVRKVKDTLYIVDPEAFVQRITNLAQFLDVLDLATAFKDGISIGCRIGKLAPQSIGVVLGFADGDIITSVNGIAPTTTANRIALYEMIRKLPRGSTIEVALLRNQREYTIQFSLERLGQSEEKDSSSNQQASVQQMPMEQERKIIAHNDQQKRMLGNIRKHDKMAMRSKGGHGALIDRIMR